MSSYAAYGRRQVKRGIVQQQARKPPVRTGPLKPALTKAPTAPPRTERQLRIARRVQQLHDEELEARRIFEEQGEWEYEDEYYYENASCIGPRRPCELPPSVYPSEGFNCPGNFCYPPACGGGYYPPPCYAPAPLPLPVVCTPAGCYPGPLCTPAPPVSYPFPCPSIF